MLRLTGLNADRGADGDPQADRLRVVVVGAAGQLGQVMSSLVARTWALTAWTRADLDLTDGLRVARAVRDIAPWAIVNCAGYNQVDLAEDEPITALEANAFAVRTLARAAESVGATFVHYSSDFVFDGESNRPYREDDRPNPRSVYAASKLLGEWFAADARSHYVLRVESLFGGLGRRKGSLDRIIESIDGREARSSVHRSRRVAQLCVGRGRSDDGAAPHRVPPRACTTASIAARDLVREWRRSAAAARFRAPRWSRSR